MKIIFFSKGDRRLPSARTRAYLISDYLKTKGYDSTVYQVKTRAWWSLSGARSKELLRNIKVLWSLNKGDLLVLQRTVHQVDFLLLIMIRKYIFRRGYIFDFDDAIFLEKGHAKLKTNWIIRNADLVTPGAVFLKEYAEKLNKHVYLTTTFIDTDNIFFPYKGKRDSDELVIGWTGTPVHYDNMKLLVEPLTRLVNEGHKIRLQLVGGGDRIPTLFKDIPGLKLTTIVHPPSSGIWSEPREVGRYIQNFDIGIYPLQKTEWNKGKDTYKAKEYAGCRVPMIMSNWGENPHIVKDGVDGVLMDEDGWYPALKKMISDPMYREKMADGARNFAVRLCSFDTHIPPLIEEMKKYSR